MARLRKQTPAFLIFISGCLLSAGIATYARQASERIDRVRFDSATRLVSRFIDARLERYVNALIHTKALFAVETRISREKFRRYVDDLDVFQKYPGTLGIGYATRKGDSFVVSSVEPSGPFSREITGSVLGSDPVRRQAIELAIRSGEPIVSPRVMIRSGSVSPGTKGNGAEEPGFVILNPVYDWSKLTDTPEEKERAVKGVVFSVFRASSFFDEIFSENPIDPAIGLVVYDGEDLSRAARLFRRYAGSSASLNPPRFENSRRIGVGGRTWSVDFRALPSFQSRWAKWGPWIFFAIGALISYLVAQMVWSMLSRIESERKLVGRVRQAISSRDEFISIASHELKTPITSLKLQLAMAMRYPEKAAELLSVSDREVSRLNRLVDELLDVTRIQAGRMKYDFERADLSELVREISARYAGALEEAGCELRLVAQGPIVAEVDRFRMEQVMVNLLSNAMKYARGKPVDIWVERDGANAVIRVTDHGMGIPMEKRELIFNRFERLNEDKATTGLGLGLYITRRIIEAHGGRIRVQSEPGQGSTFIVELPVHRDSPPEVLPEA